MKKLRNLLVVAVLLMVLGFTLQVGQAGAAPEESIEVCSDLPPSEVIGLF
jgi:hypothetical protein